MPKENDLTKDHEILDYGGVSKIRYYMDSIDGSYFYLEVYGKKVYDDKIVEPTRDPPVQTYNFSPSSGSLSDELNIYIDGLVGPKLPVGN